MSGRKINQCDGCRRGMPLRDPCGCGSPHHFNPERPWDGMVCTADLYGHPLPKAEPKPAASSHLSERGR